MNRVRRNTDGKFFTLYYWLALLVIWFLFYAKVDMQTFFLTQLHPRHPPIPLLLYSFL